MTTPRVQLRTVKIDKVTPGLTARIVELVATPFQQSRDLMRPLRLMDHAAGSRKPLVGYAVELTRERLASPEKREFG